MCEDVQAMIWHDAYENNPISILINEFSLAMCVGVRETCMCVHVYTNLESPRIMGN